MLRIFTAMTNIDGLKEKSYFYLIAFWRSMRSVGTWLIEVGPWQSREHRDGAYMVDKVAHMMGDRKQETG